MNTAQILAGIVVATAGTTILLVVTMIGQLLRLRLARAVGAGLVAASLAAICVVSAAFLGADAALATDVLAG